MRNLKTLVVVLVGTLCMGAASAQAAWGNATSFAGAPIVPTFPLKVVNGVMTTLGGTPYFILGDSPQAANTIPLCSAGNTYALCAPGGVLSSDTLPTNATFVAYAKDRQAQGFNSLWINIACEGYTRCNNAGATQEGTYPFTTQLSGTVMSGESCPESTPPTDVDCWDLSTAGAGASAAYWTHIDGYFLVANNLGMQVLANPIPTDACSTSANGGSFAYTLANNYVNAGNSYTKITSYANFLANRYKSQPNIIWFLGNDFNCFETLPGVGVPFVYISQVENSLFQFASTLKASDPTHLITLELNGLTASLLDGTGENGGATNAWSTILGLNGTYENQGPPYAVALMARALNSSKPVLFLEGDYQGEDIGSINDGSCTRTGTAGTPPVTICNANFGPFLSAASHCGYDYISGGDNSAPAGDPNSCAFRERVQFWDHTLAGGAAGYLDGNRYTWTFDTGWPTTGATIFPTTCHTISSSNNCLDTAANTQLKNGVAFMQTIAWYKLVPDVTRSGAGTANGTATAVATPFVTGCYGTVTQQACANAHYIDGNHSAIATSAVKLTIQSVYPASGVASDGSFGIAYVPGINVACNGLVYPPTNCNAATSLAIIANNALVNGGVNLTAVWYDPTTNSTTGICSPSGTPCNAGSQTYTTPGSTHADGTADWVLLVKGTGGSAGAQTPSTIAIGGSGCSGTACNVPNIDDTFASNVATGLPPNGAYIGTLSTTLSAGTPPFSGSYSLVAHVGGDNCGTGTINNAPFQLSSDQLQYNTGATAGTTYNVCVKATVGANSTTQEFTVKVMQVVNASTASGCTGAGTSGSPWNVDACLQPAVTAANAGDTVFMPAGEWVTLTSGSGTTITKGVNLLGAGSGNTLDYLGHPNNPNGAAASTFSGITHVYTGGPNCLPFPSTCTGGFISITACTTGSTAHLFIDGSIANGASSNPNVALGTFQYRLACGNSTPITITDVRSLACVGFTEPQFTILETSHVTVQNSVFSEPRSGISGGNYGTCEIFQQVGLIGTDINIKNNAFYMLGYNPIDMDNITYSGNYHFQGTDSFGTQTQAIPNLGFGGCFGVGCDEVYLSGRGNYFVNVKNNHFAGAGQSFAIGPAINDPGTSGVINDFNQIGNWIIAATSILDSCTWHGYNNTCASDTDSAGMQLNYFGSSDPVCTGGVCKFTNVNNSLIGTTAVQINLSGMGCNTNGSAAGPAGNCVAATGNSSGANTTCINCSASQNFLQAPTAQYLTNAYSVSPSQTNNYCSGGTFSGCATTGFATLPTASFTLGPLSGGVVPFTSTGFTAQYGAVKWIAQAANSPPAAPTSGDARWACPDILAGGSDACMPPVSIAAAHGNTVYVWVMDSANHIAAATPAAVP